MSPFLRYAALTLLASIHNLTPLPSFGAWPTNVSEEIPLNSGINIQEFASVSDGAGGIIIALHAYSTTTGVNIIARRYNNAGEAVWPGGLVIVCNALNDQRDIRVVPTNDGGCFVMWSDVRSGGSDIYVQKISASGQTLFSANGSPFIVAAGEQTVEDAISDGAGGFILTYKSSNLLTAQRYNSDGVALWGAPVIFSNVTGDSVGDMISDGTGGFYAGLERIGIGNEVAITRVTGSGSAELDQLLSQNADGNQYGIRLARRANGNVLAAWYDGALTARRIVTNEYVSPLVFNPNVQLNTGSGTALSSFSLIPSAHGDPLILYSRDVGADTYDVFLGRINTAGQLNFSTPVPFEPGNQLPHGLAETSGGSIRAVYSSIDLNSGNKKLVAARFSSAGVFQWKVDITHSNQLFKSLNEQMPIIGSQDSLLAVTDNLGIPQPHYFALIRVRSNGEIGGEQFGSDASFASSSVTFLRTKKKGTMPGDLSITNGGTEPTAATTVGFYFSPLPDFSSAGATFLFEIPLPALQPGETIVLQPGLKPPKKPGKPRKVRKVKLPKSVLTAPQSFILIHLDDDQLNPEFDEINNTEALGPI